MSMDNVLVSVIITFYSNENDAGKYLEEAVSSVLEQTYKNLEVLVIDDCSPVPANHYLGHIVDDRLRITRLIENNGMAKAINYGINMASGEFTAFLDFDDKWYNFKIEKQLEAIKCRMHIGNKSSTNVCCYSRVLITQGEYSYTKPNRGIFVDEHVADYIFTSGQFIQTSGLLVSTETLKNVGGMDDFKRHTDFQLILKLFHERTTFIYLDCITYEYKVIPKKGDFTFSQRWLSLNKWMMTEDAIKYFNINVVLRSMIDNNKFFIGFNYSLHNRILRHFFSYLFRCSLKKILPNAVLYFLIDYKNSVQLFSGRK